MCTRFHVGCTHALRGVLSTYTVVACLVAWGQGESRQFPEINELMRLHEFRDYQEEDYHDRIEIIRKVIERNTEKLEDHWEGGELEKVKETLQTIQFLCEYAGRESDREQDPKQLRDKEVKKLEIVARKLSAYLEDLKQTLPFPEHAPFDSTIGVLEQLRKQLLKQFWGDP